MRRRMRVGMLLVGALFAAACTDRNPFAPEPPELNVIPAPYAQCSPAFARLILSEIKQIYRSRPLLELEAGIRFAIIALQCQRKPAEARTRAVRLSAFVAQLFQDHRLPSSIPWGDVSRHIDHLYQYVGLPAPGIPPAAVGAGATIAVVEPTDPDQVVKTENNIAGVSIPTGAFSQTQTVIVTITPDPLGTNPFPNPNEFEEFRPFYNFQTFPDVPVFHENVLVGICVELPENAAQAHRLQLAHPNHANPTQLELLERVDAGFLPCNSYVRAGSDAVNLALAGRMPFVSRLAQEALALFRPRTLHAATMLSPGGLGGQTGNFSDFRAVDPGATAADLTISAPATLTVTPTSVAAGGTVTLSAWTVTNQGTASSNSFSNGFYLSTDATITTADVRLDGNGNSERAPGESFAWGGPTLTIPAGTVPGSYFIGILVDEENETAESNEGNNFKSTALTVITLSGALSDPVGDASTGPDFADASAAVAGGALTLSARFAGTSFSSATSRVAWNLDTDQNVATGFPGITSGNGDAALMGVDYIVLVGGTTFGSLVQVLSATSGGVFTTLSSGVLIPSYVSNGVDVTVPLSLLGSDDGVMNFKATVQTQLTIGSSTTIFDFISNLGVAPGTTVAP